MAFHTYPGQKGGRGSSQSSGGAAACQLLHHGAVADVHLLHDQVGGGGGGGADGLACGCLRQRRQEGRQTGRWWRLLYGN